MEILPPAPPTTGGDEFPTRGMVWIFAVLALVLLVEAAFGIWSPLDLFR